MLVSPLEVGDEHVGVSVEVEIADRNSHASLLLSSLIESDPAEKCFVAKSAIALINPQQIILRVVGDVEIRPSVLGEIVGHDAETGLGDLGDSGGE